MLLVELYSVEQGLRDQDRNLNEGFSSGLLSFEIPLASGPDRVGISF